jgi:hypothetical protein
MPKQLETWEARDSHQLTILHFMRRQIPSLHHYGGFMLTSQLSTTMQVAFQYGMSVARDTENPLCSAAKFEQQVEGLMIKLQIVLKFAHIELLLSRGFM